MTKKQKSIVQFVVLLSIGLLLAWMAYSQVADEKDKIISAFTTANYFWVLVSVVIGFSSHLVRAYRWNYLLKPLGYETTFINASAAVFIGYFFNYGIPRMGEISRCTVADRYDKVPFQVGFGTVITERIVDTIILLIIFALTLLFQFTELIGLSNKYIFDPMHEKFAGMSMMKLSILIIIGGGIVVALFLLRKRIADKLRGKFGSIIKGFLEGLSSIRKMQNLGGFIFWSLLIWAMYFYSLYFCLKAIPETAGIGHKECLTLMLFGTLGVVFTPGGLGAYPLIVGGVLVYYGIDKVPAAAFPWLIWTSQLIYISITGILSFGILPLVNKKKNVLPSETN